VAASGRRVGLAEAAEGAVVSETELAIGKIRQIAQAVSAEKSAGMLV
jgi:hypothetical protein